MPRSARVKSYDSIFHIMVRGITDTVLFGSSEDKIKYLEYVKKYQEIFGFKLYAYCLMDTHGHMIIDAAGADISDIMHRINQCYTQSYNGRHKRGGHLFWDRFKSIIVDDDSYLVTLSGYIHNNPEDIEGYMGNVENYAFSSLGIYLGLREDTFEIVDSSFVLQLFSQKKQNARMNYVDFVRTCNNAKIKREIDFQDERAEYRSERRIIKRDVEPGFVVDFVSRGLNMDSSAITAKHMRGAKKIKSLSAFIMVGYCGMKQRDICAYFGNINQSYASWLCTEGYRLVCENEICRNIYKKFIEALSKRSV